MIMKINPFECKSGKNTKSKSLMNFVNTYKPLKAFKVSMNNVNNSNKIIKAIPQYVFDLLSIEELYSL